MEIMTCISKKRKKENTIPPQIRCAISKISFYYKNTVVFNNIVHSMNRISIGGGKIFPPNNNVHL